MNEARDCYQQGECPHPIAVRCICCRHAECHGVSVACVALTQAKKDRLGRGRVKSMHYGFFLGDCRLALRDRRLDVAKANAVRQQEPR